MLATVGKGQFLSEYWVKNRRKVLFLLKSSQKPFLSLCMKKAIANNLKVRKGKIKSLSSCFEVTNMIHMERTIKHQMLSVCQISRQILVNKCLQAELATCILGLCTRFCVWFPLDTHVNVLYQVGSLVSVMREESTISKSPGKENQSRVL